MSELHLFRFRKARGQRRDEHALYSQECQLSKRRNRFVSDPLPLTPVFDGDRSDLFALLPLAEEIDPGTFMPIERGKSFERCLNDHAQTQPCDISKQARHELQQYEHSFDQSRRWRDPANPAYPLESSQYISDT